MDSQKKAALKRARERFQSTGQSIASWAREHGYSRSLVYEVLRGRECLRGESHEIAVRLGIKRGVILKQKVSK